MVHTIQAVQCASQAKQSKANHIHNSLIEIITSASLSVALPSSASPTNSAGLSIYRYGHDSWTRPLPTIESWELQYWMRYDVTSIPSILENTTPSGTRCLPEVRHWAKPRSLCGAELMGRQSSDYSPWLLYQPGLVSPLHTVSHRDLDVCDRSFYVHKEFVVCSYVSFGKGRTFRLTSV